MVLNMIYEYATNNVRNNAVRAIHQLVEAVSQVDPARALERFFPFCSEKIYTELENGASSIRTTASDSPRVLSDATLHWSK
jgi:proteasome activator subunit 4